MTEQQTTNQSGTDEDEDDFFDAATSSFPSVEHLAPSVPPKFGVGRLVAIWALENGVGKGNNGPYPWTNTITVALDDGPEGDQANDMVPAAPYRVEMRHSTTNIQGKLRGRVDGKDQKGRPLRFRPTIGRVNTQASQNNKNVPAYGLAEPTDEDMDIARRHKALIVSINQELEKAAQEHEDNAAFGG